MSRAFVKDGDQEEAPLVTPRAFLPDGYVNYVTHEGLLALNAEREALISERDADDGNEDDRRIARNYAAARLRLLEERISSAVVPGVEDRREGVVGFGAYVTVSIGGRPEKTFRIVGADEADSARGLVSYFSPMAKALYGHRSGETLDVVLQGGSRSVSIENVSYEPVSLTVQSEGSSGFLRVKRVARNIEAEISRPAAEVIPKAEPLKVMKDEGNEILPLVNDRGITVGHAPRWQCHDGSKLLHPVAHMHILNSKGEVYLQKRSEWKSSQPGKWDTSVGAHVGFGEKVEDALFREAGEKLGLKGFKPVKVKTYILESDLEKEFVHVFKLVFDGPLVPGTESADGRFWSPDEIASNPLGLFTAGLIAEYKLFKQ